MMLGALPKKLTHIALALFLVFAYCTSSETGRENVSGYLNGLAPTQLSYASATLVLYENTAATAEAPVISARKNITNCTSNPALPTGLILDSKTCSISGTPTLAQAEVKYTITATNDIGSISTQVGIEIRIPPPSNLSYAGSPFTFSNYTSVGTITPSVNGAVTSCTSSPPLPTGLSLNNTTCAITGTATTYQNPANYTVTASNAFGNTSTTINIRVDECYLRGCLRDNLNGTISFTGTGDTYAGINLVFKKCSQGQIWNSSANDCTGTGVSPTYGATFNGNCSTETFAGRAAGSWRVPTGNEQATLIHCTNKARVVYGATGCGASNYTTPAISSLFPQTPTTGGTTGGRYWASDTFLVGYPGTTYQYTTGFLDGTWSGATPSGGWSFRTRCVTTGP